MTTPSLKSFGSAVQSAMSSDTGAGSIVSLTGHTSSSPRLFRAMIPAKERVPCITFECDLSAPYIEDSTQTIMETMVVFGCWAYNAGDSIELADRLMYLLMQDFGCGGPTEGWNISDSNVNCLSTRFRSRDEVTFSQEYDVWGIIVRAEFRWHEKS